MAAPSGNHAESAETNVPRTVPVDHLGRLMGPMGLFEHARYRQPRHAHGYTTDDNSRALVVTAGLPDAGWIFDRCLRFVMAAASPGLWRNRMTAEGRWSDRDRSEDAHGRAIWGMGATMAGGATSAGLVEAFDMASRVVLVAPRAIAYSVLGAAHAVVGGQAVDAAERIIERYSERCPVPRPGRWRWPEDRLTYANARIPQAMIVAGETMDRAELIADGLDLLEWLVEVEWRDDHFSFTPVRGRGSGERGPVFDQQPIEAWAMADACAVAGEVTHDAKWRERVEAAVEWFWGRNDGSRLLVDSVDGACFDGLQAEGVNRNSGAESTLSALGAHRTWGRLATSLTP